MKHHNTIRVRRQSWAIAAVLLLAFSWLGFAAVKFAPIYQALEGRLDAGTRFALAYGAVAFPLLGILAAASVILSDLLLQGRAVQWTLIVLFVSLAFWAFQALVFTHFSMGPAFKANPKVRLGGDDPTWISTDETRRVGEQLTTNRYPQAQLVQELGMGQTVIYRFATNGTVLPESVVVDRKTGKASFESPSQ